MRPVLRSLAHPPWAALRRLADLPGRGLRRFRGHRGHLATAASVGRASALLVRSNEALEAAFIRLGDHLEPLAERMQGLVEGSHELADLASGREEGASLFQEAVEMLDAPLEHLARLVQRQDELLRLLRRCEDQTASMLGFQAEIEAILAPLAYIEILFRVEAAALPQEERETFLAVSSEIARLRKLVSDTFQGNTDALERTHETLAEVRLRHSERLRRQAVRIASEQKNIGSALERLDAELQRGQAHDTQTRQLSSDLARTIEDVVTAGQAQDIVSQQTAHLLEALRSIQTSDRSLPEMTRLADRQLREVNRTLERATRDFREGNAQMRELAGRVDVHCTHEAREETSIASADGMVQTLIDALSDIAEMVDQTNEVMDELYEAARPAANIVQTINAALAEVSINMHLIALNAQIRSEQISSGTGLDTLAARTAEISLELTGAGTRLATDIDELREATTALFALFEDFSTSGRAHEKALRERRGPVETHLHAFRDRTLRVFTGLVEAVDAVQQLSGQMDEGIADLEKVAQGFHRAQRLLGSCLHGLGDRSCDRDRALLADHARRYSMRSERLVHAEVRDGATPAVLEGDDATELELFDTAEPASAPPSAPSPARPAATAPARRSPARATPPPVDLDDGIELF
ncbi:MAG: hypothetical protein ACOC3I_04785 [Verrucomicrobiota bacterium]